MQGNYDVGLVLLSIMVAAVASYSALNFAGRITSGRRLWLVGGGMAMGFGIWSMHFIGMLAFSLPVPLAYDPTITAASLAIAVVTSGVALWVVAHLARGEDEGPDWPILIAGAVIMGAGISGMHYTGMAAMRMTPPILYTPWLFVLSIVVAVTVSVVALWLAFTLRAGDTQAVRHHRVLAAVVMGLAIAGMHYTGMAAAVFQPGAICGASGVFALDGTTLGYLLGGATLVLLLAAISAPRPLPTEVTPPRA